MDEKYKRLYEATDELVTAVREELKEKKTPEELKELADALLMVSRVYDC